ncbi:mechanosensitive ion channel protein MscS [Marinobacter vulgaris]|uniref:Mechanosensitive ion channel protein MscS n=1 Tax=Marinobacter vulgaris TaxID=1928331 RepID=A0A2V3ZN36_9GAMM|nr:mechanosensitive ion channel domain-containing protein [Marinobacter vulgaris]PXX92353.1 mechanosensitive ion channel protein MscS [Marinobacter vulgaris]TSJ71703.1 mechanosensitive ion channel family protein [Marinobacter vulgaris]
MTDFETLNMLKAGLEDWLRPGITALLSLVFTFLIYEGVLAIIKRLTRSKTVPRLFLDASETALGIVISLLVLNGVLETFSPDLLWLNHIQHAATLFLIIAVTWALVRCTSAIGNVIVAMNPVLEGQWKRARKVETQTRFLVRILNILVIILGLGAALMTFEPVQHLGGSLLASAGVGGIILGFAAKPVLSNLLAGMQIALTQPFRIDDVLHVQGEWCWVEEVTATYVVLRVWDLRRLVVPLQWFIENPFQNWSRNDTELTGPVFLHVDYSMPIEPLRTEYDRLLRQSPQWNGNTATVQVTDAGDTNMEVRLLMSAKDSSGLWDLRCAIREGMITFIQEQFPDQLPRVRARLVDQPDQ